MYIVKNNQTIYIQLNNILLYKINNTKFNIKFQLLLL